MTAIKLEEPRKGTPRGSGSVDRPKVDLVKDAKEPSQKSLDGSLGPSLAPQRGFVLDKIQGRSFSLATLNRIGD